MKAMEKTLQLGNDGVFVVSRISNQSARRSRGISRQLRSVRDATRKTCSQHKRLPAAVVHIRLIVRATAINVVKVQGRRPKVGQSIWVVLHLQATRRVKCNVVIDEL